MVPQSSLPTNDRVTTSSTQSLMNCVRGVRLREPQHLHACSPICRLHLPDTVSQPQTARAPHRMDWGWMEHGCHTGTFRERRMRWDARDSGAGPQMSLWTQ